ncbi:helix-turn-helix domain-containing protein [Desulfococcaceae bacterium HSG7]|nr:helix-turn-helix domain-containing protein [Desulfococcaceae bacterium HSG7]
MRERKDDIPLLSNHYLKHFSKSSQNEIKGISAEALELIEKYHWPGNVRELQNIMERAVSLTDSEMIVPDDLPGKIRSMKNPDELIFPTCFDYKKAKKEWTDSFEKKYLAALLDRHNGNISKAAREAQINCKTIHRLIKRHRLMERSPG